MVEDRKESTSGDPQVITLEDLDESSDVIRINGESFDLHDTKSMGLLARARATRLMKRIDQLEQIEESAITDADEAEYRVRLLEVAAIAIPAAPHELVEKLRVGQLADLAAVFFARAAMKSPRLKMLAQLTSATSSPASNTATGATP